MRESPFPGETRRAEGGVQRQASHETIQRRVGKIEVVTCMYFAVHIGGPVLQSVSNLYVDFICLQMADGRMHVKLWGKGNPRIICGHLGVASWGCGVCMGGGGGVGGRSLNA